MKFYIILLALIINACTVLKDEGSTSFKKSSDKHEFNDLVVELKDVILEDSSTVTFISIHPDYSQYRNIPDYCGRHFTYSGPLTIGDYFDTCSFYPVAYDWKSQSSYFLIDDFTDVEDSLLYFSYHVSARTSCQGGDQIYQLNSGLSRTELVKYMNSLVQRSEKTYATKEWFSMWYEKNSAYQGLRTNPKMWYEKNSAGHQELRTNPKHCNHIHNIK